MKEFRVIPGRRPYRLVNVTRGAEAWIKYTPKICRSTPGYTLHIYKTHKRPMYLQLSISILSYKYSKKYHLIFNMRLLDDKRPGIHKLSEFLTRLITCQRVVNSIIAPCVSFYKRVDRTKHSSTRWYSLILFFFLLLQVIHIYTNINININIHTRNI